MSRELLQPPKLSKYATMQAAYAERRPLSHKNLSLKVKASHADVGQVEAEVLTARSPDS
jgi:hypothetical protein